MSVYSEYKPPEGGNNLYHKFEDGVTYIMRIVSEPVVFQTEFQRGEETNISTKYAWLAWDVEGKHPVILQLPVTAYKQVAAFATDPDYGDPTNYNLKMTRTGTGLDTQYNIIASPKQIPLAEVEGAENAKEELDKLDLVELVEKGKGVSHVMWLKDALGDKGTKMTQSAVMDTMSKPANTVDDGPVDLSDIPF